LEKHPTTIYKIAGRNIRALRQKMGVSQEELAELCDLHRTYIGSVERGERNITLKTLKQIAVALNVKAESLIKDV